jgi:hypothetical protein
MIGWWASLKGRVSLSAYRTPQTRFLATVLRLAPLVVAHFAIYHFTRDPENWRSLRYVPAVGWLLLWLAIAGYILTLLALALDKFPIPLTVFLLLWFCGAFYQMSSDHTIELLITNPLRARSLDGTDNSNAFDAGSLAAHRFTLNLPKNDQSNSHLPLINSIVASDIRGHQAHGVRTQSMEVNHKETCSPEDAGSTDPNGSRKVHRHSLESLFVPKTVAQTNDCKPNGPPDHKQSAVPPDPQWRFPEGTSRRRIMCVVCAAGGGIQSAAWTGKVLHELDKIPGFKNSVGIVSSVSGGSVASLHYLTHFQRHNNGCLDSNPPGSTPADMTPLQPEQDGTFSESDHPLLWRLRESSMEEIAWGFAFPDTLRVMTMGLYSGTDRSEALQAGWRRRIARGYAAADIPALNQITINSLIPVIREAKLPVPIFNLTCVETGQRVLISPFDGDFSDKLGSRIFTNMENSSGGTKNGMKEGGGPVRAKDSAVVPETKRHRIDQPFDLLTRLTTIDRVADIGLCDAVRMSAAFAYVSPVVRLNPVPADIGFNIGQISLEEELRKHYCDGGYADNTGVVSAVESTYGLFDAIERCIDKGGGKADKHFEPLFHDIVIVRIDGFPEEEIKSVPAISAFGSLAFGPAAGLNRARISSQAERADIEVALLQEYVATQSRHRLRVRQLEVQRTLNVLAELRHQGKWKCTDDDWKEIQNVSTSKERKEDDVAAEVEAARNRYCQLQTLWERTPCLSYTDHAVVQVIQALDSWKEAVELDCRTPLQQVRVYSVTYRFAIPEGHESAGASPPLSWTLNPVQAMEIDDAWEDLTRRSENFERPGLSHKEFSEMFHKPNCVTHGAKRE